MESEKLLSEILGISIHTLSEKSSGFVMLTVQEVMKTGTIDTERLLEYVKKTYTHEELLYMSMSYLTEKSSKILSMPETKEAFRASMVGNMDEFLQNLMNKADAQKKHGK